MENTNYIIKSLKNDKTKINQNKNPVPMQLFLSFLNVEVSKSTDHLGASNGWTEFYNKEHDLIISGGVCDGGHWLHMIQYGKKLQNAYNNYVNPFYLFDIMNDNGKIFFLKYFKEDIYKLIHEQKKTVDFAKRKAKEEAQKYSDMLRELNDLTLTIKP